MPNWDGEESEIWAFMESVAKLFQLPLQVISVLEGENYSTYSMLLFLLSCLEKSFQRAKVTEVSFF